MSLGRTSNVWLTVSRVGPIGLGTVLLVMVWPGEKYLAGFCADTRSMYCSPTADTECTFAEESIGILYWSLIRNVARTPCSVGSTRVTFPTVIPR
ncbi:Uncharacterised protein [Mycobacteroides abscessus subsp. abscessus]|nr:Uncharacterised protein [Mycobacteroides abscessus subsp. abscessus]